jgi:hypothetical protein
LCKLYARDFISLLPNQSYDFTAYGLDQHGEPVDVNVTWTATGGAITEAVFYTAGSDSGTFYDSSSRSRGICLFTFHY